MATLAAVQSSCAFASSDYLDRAIQRELAALAALAAVHRSACCWLDAWSGPERVKEHLARHIASRHRTEREPHLLRLAELHQQRAAVTPPASLVSVGGNLSASVRVETLGAWKTEQGPGWKPAGLEVFRSTLCSLAKTRRSSLELGFSSSSAKIRVRNSIWP